MGTPASLQSVEPEVKGKICKQIVNGNVTDNVIQYEEKARTNQHGKEETFALDVGNDKEKKTVEDPQEIVSDDGILSRKDDIFKRLHETIGKILKNPRLCDEFGNINKALPALLKDVDDMFEEFATIGQLSYNVVERYQQEASQLLSRSRITCVLCRVIMDSLRFNKRNGDGVLSNLPKAVDLALIIIVNTSDVAPEVTYDIAQEPNFLETLKELLTSHISIQLAEEEDDEEHVDGKEEGIEEHEAGMNNTGKFIDDYLTIIHNTSMVTANTQRLRDLEFVKVLLSYLDSKDDDIRLNALSTLANIINEEESALLQDKQDVIEFMLETLGSALEDLGHRCEGWSAQELTLTIRRLARNDANKKLLVEMGSLPYLMTLANSEKVEEQREAVEAMWVLAFDRDNKKKILEDKKLNIVDMLVDLRKRTEDTDVKKVVDGILWILREDIQSNEKYKNMVTFDVSWKKLATSGKGSSGHMKQDKQDKNGHIMISYNWSHQKELKQIRDLLKENGYSVWMDIDSMSGSTLQAMAEAVELAHVVFICMSQKYKDSSNCRAEAEYAFQLQKKIIPLKMERNYKPDGWLGFIAGAKKYFEFSGKYQFDNIFKDLLKEVAVCFANSGPETIKSQIAEDKVDAVPLSVTPTTVSHPNHKMPVSALRQWTPKEVEQWLVNYNLPKRQLRQLTGKDLSALVKMKKEAPEFFYNYLFRELKIKNLSMIDTFTDALEDLTV